MENATESNASVEFGQNPMAVVVMSIKVLRAVKAYPNPTSGDIEIEIASGSKLEIVVSDLSGRIVRTKQVSRTGVKVDITGEVAGIYLMTVKDLDSSEVRTFRIVKF